MGCRWFCSDRLWIGIKKLLLLVDAAKQVLVTVMFFFRFFFGSVLLIHPQLYNSGLNLWMWIRDQNCTLNITIAHHQVFNTYGVLFHSNYFEMWLKCI